MALYTISPCVDLGVFYEADSLRYKAAKQDVIDIITKEFFVKFYENCASIGFQYCGQPIGGVIFDGTEAHIAVLPKYRGRWALLLKPALIWLFNQKSEITVKIEQENMICIAFMDRNCWKRVGEDESEITYLLTQQGGTRKTAHLFSRRV